MFGTESNIDANFYRLIHQLAGPQTAIHDGERRYKRRQPFPSVQRIAPHDGSGVPDEAAFQEVQCYDLNRAGFSFFLVEKPEFETLVVAFGDEPNKIYAAAEVAHVGNVLLYPSGQLERVDSHDSAVCRPDKNGQKPNKLILVGCRFTHRVESE